jgi:hypothetical protein
MKIYRLYDRKYFNEYFKPLKISVDCPSAWISEVIFHTKVRRTPTTNMAKHIIQIVRRSALDHFVESAQSDQFK